MYASAAACIKQQAKFSLSFYFSFSLRSGKSWKESCIALVALVAAAAATAVLLHVV
jgi:hypothetical protein